MAFRSKPFYERLDFYGSSNGWTSSITNFLPFKSTEVVFTLKDEQKTDNVLEKKVVATVST